MPDLHEMDFKMMVTAYDGEQFGYDQPEDMGFVLGVDRPVDEGDPGGDEVLQIKFDGGRRHHFDVEEIESVVLIRQDE